MLLREQILLIVFYEDISDHVPICATIKCKRNKISTQRSFRRKIRRENIDLFLNQLSAFPNSPDMRYDSKLDSLIRGGIEDTRLEAKAKDTKKIRGQGQGQPFRGQTLSRPKTGMLEAKAKDQGHKRKCSPKKKVFKKNFQAISTKNVFQKIFQALHKILTIQKIVLSSSRGQANFRGLETSRPRLRTSKRVLEAKDVLEDSTSESYNCFTVRTTFNKCLFS